MKKLFRWKAIVPLLLVLVLLGLVWRLMLDGLVRRGIEEAGAQITGARVDVARAHVGLTSGVLRLEGIQAADPDAPMTNLVEIGEVVADLRVWPLLQKKVIVDTLAVRGVRFGTERTRSGVLERKGRTTGEAARRIETWSDNLPRPSFSLEGLGRTVDVGAVHADSLRTIQAARAVPERADSLWSAWQDQVRSLDIQPQLETGRALAERLRGASLRSLGIEGIRDAVRDLRDITRTLEEKREGLRTLETGVEQGLSGLRRDVAALDELRDRDLAWARARLDIPSLEAPDIGPALFGEMARGRLEPLLRWLAVAERYMPPGLKQRPRPGPERVRAAGTTVDFPRRESLPAFLLTFGQIELDLGSGERTDRYDLVVQGVTSDPVVYGRPTLVHLERALGTSGGGVGAFRAGAVLDHRTAPPLDSLDAVVRGMELAATDLGGLGGRLDLGRGDTTLRLVRRGEDLDARLTWTSEAVTWTSTRERQGIETFVWDTLSRLQRVEIEMHLTGTLQRPRMAVRSNVAEALSRGLRDQLGEEVRRAEARVRAEVDRQVQPYVTAARSRVDEVRGQAEARIQEVQTQLDRVKSDLEARLRELTRGLPPGIIPPD